MTEKKLFPANWKGKWYGNCEFCGEPVLDGQPSFYRPGDDDRMTIRFVSHVDCWLRHAPYDGE